MSRQHIRLLLASLFAAFGVVLTITVVVRQGAGGDASQDVVVADREASDRLKAIETYSVPEAGADGGDRAREELQTKLQQQLRVLVSEDGRSLPASLAATAAERLALYAFPSWESYTLQASALAAGAGVGAGVSGMLTEEQWSQFASQFSGAEYALDKAEIRVSSEPDEDMLWLLMKGGQLTTTRDKGLYANGFDQPADVYYVTVPIRLPNWRQADGSLELLLVQSYRRRASDGRWVPYMAGVYDPEGKARSLPPPWL
ncbi:MAG: hypothetical protein Q9O74_10730 [Planctomycetota bacterium]|nr:hypothetical protein [Planctomycetota bacterium]